MMISFWLGNCSELKDWRQLHSERRQAGKVGGSDLTSCACYKRDTLIACYTEHWQLPLKSPRENLSSFDKSSNNFLEASIQLSKCIVCEILLPIVYPKELYENSQDCYTVHLISHTFWTSPILGLLTFRIKNENTMDSILQFKDRIVAQLGEIFDNINFTFWSKLLVSLDNRDNKDNQDNKHQGQEPRLRTTDQVLPQVDRLPQEGISPSMGLLTHLVQVLHHLRPVDINLVALLVISLEQLGYQSSTGGYQSGTIGSGYQSGTTGSGYQSGTTGSGYQSGTTGSGYQSGTTGSGYQSGTTGSGYQSATNWVPIHCSKLWIPDWYHWWLSV